MLDSLHTGLSGLLAFSKGLSVISNNVSNLNSPGFKGNDLAFTDLYYRYEAGLDGQGKRTAAALGTGVEAGDTRIRYNQGDFQDTGRPSTVASGSSSSTRRTCS
jgi:flagellar hook protein FlgE